MKRQTTEEKEIFIVIAWILTLFLGIMLGFIIHAKGIIIIIVAVTMILTSILIEIILLIKLKDFDIVLKKHGNEINIDNESIDNESIDIFYATLLKDFKNNFEDESEYSGNHIKLLIDNLLKKI